MRILYVNAIMSEESGECLKAGLLRGLNQSAVAKREGIELVSYDIFYGARRYPRLMGEWARDGGFDAIVLSGSEKNTTDAFDPWIQDYCLGLRDLLDIRPGRESEWDGPPCPILGICFGHQALAVALGGETMRMSGNVGARRVQTLPQASRHANYAPYLARGNLKMIVYHADHVLRIPRGFHATLTSDYCVVQGMAHDRFPIHSVQAHPEMNETIKQDSTDQESWANVPDSDFEENDGPGFLAAFADRYSSTRP